jgi:hypothetical protein
MNDIIWRAELDTIFECTVTRTGEYSGILKVKNTANAFVLLEKAVGLSYGAKFGPDMGDVADWQDQCCHVVDEQ